jgi:hypothetical protein
MGSGGPVKAVLKTLKALHWKLCWYASSATPVSVFSPSMASFLKRTANASFVPRLLLIGPSYVGQRLPRSSRLQFEMPRADNA